MKTIGLIGGMSWESSIEYYRIINEETHKRLGGLHNAISIMYTVDFHELEQMQHSNRWADADRVMISASKSLEAAGADFIVICTNTMHKSVPAIEKEVKLPILHIADATAAQVKQDGLKKIGLLGTRFTMEEDFYKGRLHSLFDIEVVIPDETERAQIHKVIYEELVLGKVVQRSKESFLKVIDRLVQQGVEGVILGCTEIGLLVKDTDTKCKLYDTTLIHAKTAVDMAIE